MPVPTMSSDAAATPLLSTRDLCEEDYDHGFLECLGQLTTVGDIPRSAFLGIHHDVQCNRLKRIERMAMFRKHSGLFRHRVIVDQAGRVMAAGTLLVEPKFIHECGLTGHIEDIVVHSDARGLGLGKRIVQDLTGLAKEAGCYKVTLECSDDNLPFYDKCGFSRKGNQMCIYFS